MHICLHRLVTKTFFIGLMVIVGEGGKILAADLSPEVAVNEGKRLGLIEIHLPFEKEYTNPFDPDEVTVQGHFQGPDGVETVVDGFADQDYTMSHGDKDAWDHLAPKGDPFWAVRFAPTKAGNYTWWVTRKDSTGDATSGKESLSIADDPTAKGFIRVAPNHTQFEYEDGSAYYPIAMDIGWASKGGMYDMTRWFQLLSQNGGNQTRVFMTLVGNPLERVKVPAGGASDNGDPAKHLTYVGNYVYPDLNERTQNGQSDPGGGLGRMDLANAWRYDYLLDQARQDGIHLQFCQMAASAFTSGGFPWNPYNKANGGMLDEPNQFFTDAGAKSYFKRHLRYVVSRYGWSPQVLAWELFNEVDDFSHKVPYASDDSAAWHSEMAKYLKQIDPNHHMVTTSFAFKGWANIDSIPEIDYTQDHTYNMEDSPPMVADINTQLTTQFGKPHVHAEFGLEFMQRKFSGGEFTDTKGVHLETAYWASLASPGAGTIWPWYWDNYIEPLNLFPILKPVAEFAANVPWNKVKWTTLDAPKMKYTSVPDNADFQTLRITPVYWNGLNDVAKTPQTFRVGNDGTFDPPIQNMAWMLAAPKHGVANPTTFDVNYQQPGKFQVEVTIVGKGGGKLEVSLDDKVMVSKAFPAGPAPRNFQFKYISDYPIDVPAGHHMIQVVNQGNDGFAVNYSWMNYLSPEIPRLKFYGMRGDDTTAILYLYNQDYTWRHMDQAEVPNPVPASQFVLPGLQNGQYNVEIWSPSEGKMVDQMKVAAGPDGLPISLPEVTNDVAVKIQLAPNP